MSSFSLNTDRFCEYADGDAYRAYLISRNQSPIVYHSGAMHLKRLRVALRHARYRLKSFIASMHLAMVAARVRRVRFESAWFLVHHDDSSRSRKVSGAGR